MKILHKHVLNNWLDLILMGCLGMLGGLVCFIVMLGFINWEVL